MIGQDAWAQLAVMRDISNKTQTLHEAQVINLKMWPLIAVSHADPSTGQIELAWQTNTIQFVLTKMKGSRKPKNLDERLQKLDEAVKDMLGNWWTVQVILDKVVIYNGPATGQPQSNLQAALRIPVPEDRIAKRRKNQNLTDSEGKSVVLDRDQKQST